MEYKTILVHCDANPKLSERLSVVKNGRQRLIKLRHLLVRCVSGAIDIW